MGRLGIAVLLSLCPSMVLAADIRKAPPQPSADAGLCKEREELIPDIFGFSSGSDVASFRSVGLGIEYGGAFGERSARFSAYEFKGQVSMGLLPCVEVGTSIFGGREISQSFDAIDETVSESFGAGLEIKLKLLGRAQYGFGLTLGPVDIHLNHRTMAAMVMMAR